MNRSVFSPHWHQVADLKPRLVAHTRLFRHLYRDQLWYVLQDSVGGKYHRVSPAAYALLARLDGRRSVQALWNELCAGGGELPGQDEIVDLLVQLHAVDLLHCDVTPDSATLLRRHKERKRARWLQRIANPLALRFAIVDPDAFLTRVAPYVRPLFGPLGAVLWLALVVPAVILAFMHASELTENLSDRVLSADNLLLMGLLFIPVKLLHELGHGFATKVWGGSVREMGLMFLVFAPIPYVDSSSAAAFTSKYRRAVVGAAGMMVELALASCSLYVWLLVEPGITRAIAFNVILIGGISTLLVNGNPLLRYDGYYILSDLIEIPNLGQRGQQYWRYLADRYLFRARTIEAPIETSAEKRWLVPYTVLSWAYRVSITLGIILFVAQKYFAVGAILAAWGIWNLLGMSIWRTARHIQQSPALLQHRQRAAYTAVIVAAGLVAAITLVPLPMHTQAAGVVWLADDSQVRAGGDGFFVRWLIQPGAYVRQGTALLVMSDPQLESQYGVAQAKLAELQARYEAKAFTNASDASIIDARLDQARQQLALIAHRRDRLTVRANANGILTASKYQDLPGRFLHRGDLIGFVLDRSKFIVRVPIAQEDVDLVRNDTTEVSLRVADDPLHTVRSHLLREFPRAVNKLPSAALSTAGGGQIPADPRDSSGKKTINDVFLFDVALDPVSDSDRVGSHVYVRFQHRSEPLARQVYERARQLLLSRLNV